MARPEDQTRDLLNITDLATALGQINIYGSLMGLKTCVDAVARDQVIRN